MESLAKTIESANMSLGYPSRWVAIKLLEGDSEIRKLFNARSEKVVHESDFLGEEISQVHGENASR